MRPCLMSYEEDLGNNSSHNNNNNIKKKKYNNINKSKGFMGQK